MIRHRETEKYYQGQGRWTSDVRQAMQFENLSGAFSEAQAHGLSGPCEFVVLVDGRIGFRVLLAI